MAADLAASHRVVTGVLDLFAPSHIGLVAADIDAAMAEIGLDGSRHIPYQVRDGIQTVPLRTAWGQRGPLRVELMQGVAGTIWPIQGGVYMHHLGFGVEDLELEARKLVDLGLTLELTRAGRPPGEVNGVGLFRFASGLLIELVSLDID
jgi:hypothetical protein